MKYVFSLITLLFILSFSVMEDIYQQPLKTIDGVKIELSKYRGKKMLFVIVPLSASDTSLSLKDLSELQRKYKDSLVVIGVPAEETGFKKGDEEKLKKFYKDMGGNFILTEGMKVKKGAEQSNLFQWLTSKEKNTHFDKDVKGVGSKFFVSQTGELYAVMGPQLKLTDPYLDRIVRRQRP